MPGFTIEDVRAFWDGVGEEYDRINGRFRTIHHQRFRKAMELWDRHRGELGGRPPLRILNVWSRTGEAVPYLRERFPGASILHMEVSGKFLEISRRKFPGETFRQTDLDPGTLSFPEPFDLILSLETLEHCPSPKGFLGCLAGALHPRGILVLSAPTATMEIPMRVYQRFAEDHGEGPHRFYFSWQVKGMISGAGLRLLEHAGTLFFPLEWSPLLRLSERITPAMNALGLSDLGLRQFYVAGK